MPISDLLTLTAGFVVENDTPHGTCFRVTVPSELHPEDHRWDHSYLITAAHCVPANPDNGTVWFANADRRLRKLPGRFDWRVHPSFADDPTTGIDIAAAPVGHENDWWYALPLADIAVDRARIPYFVGADIYYFGLLSPVASMAERGQPMVRGATLGAIDVENVHYVDDFDDKIPHLASRAHLIDCRSLGGFSGSPCFIEGKFPGPPKQPIPAMWRKELARHRPDLADIEFDTLHYFYALFGMLVAYADYDGVAVVLPIDLIHEIVNLEDFVTKRNDDDEQLEKEIKDKGRGFRSASARAPGDERVSLPVEFEDAVKALLSTPPNADPE